MTCRVIRHTESETDSLSVCQTAVDDRRCRSPLAFAVYATQFIWCYTTCIRSSLTVLFIAENQLQPLSLMVPGSSSLFTPDPLFVTTLSSPSRRSFASTASSPLSPTPAPASCEVSSSSMVTSWLPPCDFSTSFSRFGFRVGSYQDLSLNALGPGSTICVGLS